MRALGYLQNRQRWTRQDYADALLALNMATIDKGNGREGKLFKGLTPANGFYIDQPEKITRAKMRTIKKLFFDLQVIRARRVIGVSPRKKKRITEVKKASGFRSPYMATFPLVVLPTSGVRVKWTKKDKPVLDYFRQKVTVLNVPITKTFYKHAVEQVAEADGDQGDLDAIIAESIRKQARDAIGELSPFPPPDSRYKFRLQTIWGGVEADKSYAVNDDVNSLIDSLAQFANTYMSPEQSDHFVVGFSVWSVPPRNDFSAGMTFKPPAKDVRDSRQAQKRRRIKGR